MELNDHCRVLGLKPVHLACLFGDRDELIKLVVAGGPGFDVNLPVRPQLPKPHNEPSWPRGETCLMLATLMGHLDIVEILVARNARVSQEDKSKHTAASFYCITQASLQQRTFYLQKGLGCEHPDSTNARIAIQALLTSSTRQRFLQQQKNPGWGPLGLAKAGTVISAWEPVAQINMGVAPGSQKTIGVLRVYNDNMIKMWAKSGFRPKHETAEQQVLDASSLSQIARNVVVPILPRRLQFSFKKSKYDNGGNKVKPQHIGRANSSHVEIQLSTEYIIQLANQGTPDSSKTLKEKIQLLGTMMIPFEQRHAIIYLTSVPCRSCQTYVMALQSLTRVTFHLEAMVGIWQCLRQKGKWGQLRDVPQELWYDEGESADDQNIDCLDEDLRLTIPQIIPSSTTTGPPETQTRAAQRISKSPIIDLTGDDGYDTDGTLGQEDHAYDLQQPTRSGSSCPLLSTLRSGQIMIKDDDDDDFDIEEISRPIQVRPESFLLGQRQHSFSSTSFQIDTPCRRGGDEQDQRLFVSDEGLTDERASPGSTWSRIRESVIARRGPFARNVQAASPDSSASYRDNSWAFRQWQKQRKALLTSRQEQPAAMSRASSRARSPSLARSIAARRRGIHARRSRRTAASKRTIARARRARNTQPRKGEPKVEPPKKTFGDMIDLEYFRFNG